MQRIDLLVRLEWAAVAILAVVAYWVIGAGWGFFFLLVLAPDLSMLGYLAGPRIGAHAYNLAHLLVWPALLIGASLLVLAGPTALAVGLIWLVHISVDRALGYGLKLPTGFRDTHLGRIGHDVR